MSKYKTEHTFNPHLPNLKPNSDRKQNIIWFYPPFNNQVSTSVGKAFFSYKKIFHSTRGCTIFNKNNVKLKQSCTPNMGNIAAQNEILINQHGSLPEPQLYNSRVVVSGAVLHTKSCITN